MTIDYTSLVLDRDAARSRGDFVLADVAQMTLAWESDHYERQPTLPLDRKAIVRLHLIQEELAELTEACLQGSLSGALDALTDLDVVVAGTWLTFGLQAQRLVPSREPGRFPWPAVPDPTKCLWIIYFIQKPLGVLGLAIANRDWIAIHRALVDLDRSLDNAWQAFNLTTVRERASAEVLRSNLSKLDPATAKVIKSEAGRVLKGPAYSPPDLETVLLLGLGDGVGDGEACCDCGVCPPEQPFAQGCQAPVKELTG